MASGRIHSPINALLTLAFALPPKDLFLDREIYTLVGSFFNRHAVAHMGSDSL